MEPLKSILFRHYINPSVDCSILYILQKEGFCQKRLFPYIIADFGRQEYFRSLELFRTIGQIMQFIDEHAKKAP